MKSKTALTLTLSHPMGEGTAAECFRFCQVVPAGSMLISPKSWERFSLSRLTGEGRGEGFVKPFFRN
jgi:hypothetical protein